MIPLLIILGLLGGACFALWVEVRNLTHANRELLAERTEIWRENTQLSAQVQALQANIDILAPGYLWQAAPNLNDSTKPTGYEPTSESAIDHG